MTSVVNAHTFSLEVEDGECWLKVRCGYDVEDDTRPCWPHDEDSTPLAAPQTICTYEGWNDNLAIYEILHGKASFPLPTAEVHWTDDGMEVHI